MSTHLDEAMGQPLAHRQVLAFVASFMGSHTHTHTHTLITAPSTHLDEAVGQPLAHRQVTPRVALLASTSTTSTPRGCALLHDGSGLALGVLGAQISISA
jgi:hypothetical protein